MAAFELAVCLLDIREAVDFSDRDLETPRLDQLGQIREDLRARALRVAGGLDAVLLGGRDVADGVDPIGHDSQPERQFDVTVAEGIDEGIDPTTCGGADPNGPTTSGDAPHSPDR